MLTIATTAVVFVVVFAAAFAATLAILRKEGWRVFFSTRKTLPRKIFEAIPRVEYEIGELYAGFASDYESEEECFWREVRNRFRFLRIGLLAFIAEKPMEVSDCGYLYPNGDGTFDFYKRGTKILAFNKASEKPITSFSLAKERDHEYLKFLIYGEIPSEEDVEYWFNWVKYYYLRGGKYSFEIRTDEYYDNLGNTGVLEIWKTKGDCYLPIWG